MACRQCEGIERFFDERAARHELRAYRRRGPSRATRMLLDELDRLDVQDRSFLDVGGGVGAIQHELMAAGAAGGVHADASPAYLVASRSEAELRGHADRVRFLEGDFLDVQEEAGDADFVTLDRVICCYHDMQGLVDATAPRSRRAYALVFPRVNPLTRVAFRLLNLLQTLRRHPFHVFLHATTAVRERVASHGLRLHSHRHTFLWQVTVWVRPE